MIEEKEKAGWHNASLNRYQSIVDCIHYKGWKFHIGWDHRYYIQAQFMAADVGNLGSLELQKSRKWFLSEHMTDSEVVQTVFLCVKTAEEHELRENFLLNGTQVFGPHHDLFGLAYLIQEKTIQESHRNNGVQTGAKSLG